jgi:hypothetical protein
MNARELWATARRALIAKLGRSLDHDVLFADDRLVTYDVPASIRVKRSDLFRLEDDVRWAGYLDPRPTWIHFNLLTIEPTLSVVTLRRSDDSMLAGDERAIPVNVSAEPTRARIE